MAVIKKDNSYMEFPLQISRQYGAPIDKYSVFYSQEEATAYATTNPLAYVGQIIAIVDESANTSTAYMITNTNGELVEVGKGASKPMMFVADETAMLALTDIEVGQQVYREDKHTVWIFKGGDASQLSNWVESAAQNDTVWNGTTNKVIFYNIAETAYRDLQSKDSNTLYFTDAGRIYKGDLDLTSSVEFLDTDQDLPEPSISNYSRLYIKSLTVDGDPDGDHAGYGFYLSTGSQYYNVLPGVLTDGANWANADGSKLATIALIKKGIKESIEAIKLNASFDKTTGTVKVGEGQGAVLTGVAHDVIYDESALKITIPVFGGEDVVVNIPKDKFVTAGKYYEDYPEAPATATHHKVIVLTIDNQEDPVIIPAEALVNIYKPNNEGKDVTVTISEDNKISASLRIDPVAGNAIVSTENGVKVDISTKLDKIADANGSKVALTKSDGTIEESSYAIQSTGDLSDSATDLAVASIVKAFVVATVNAAKQALQTAIDNKVDKVEGVVDNVVAFAADGAIKDSGKTIGGATLNANPDENTLATEAAVSAAMSWETI